MLRSPVEAEVEEPGLVLTQDAIERMQELTREDDKASLLRLTVEAGGCSGFQYVFGLDNKVNEDDRVFEQGGARLVTDMVSLEHVKGATVDWTTDLIKSAFEVTNNPNAAGGCGCGSSFEPKM
ncbi:hypothetical protein WJX72_008554 [[Myrmecia] bisecta]|uniref:Core domain-containing protein n=1 Tax=[Myrmecia] bisecta TaxID=41462 RepID=A0AAW1PXF6_9CHLO